MPLQLLPNRGKLLVRDAPRVIGTLPGARWNGTQHGYELTLTLDTLTRVRETLGLTGPQIYPACHPDLLSWVRAARDSADEAADALDRVRRRDFVAFPWMDTVRDANGLERPPYEHQKVMATFAYLVDGAAFFCQMRTGKTRAFIEAASQKARDGAIGALFVTCPMRVIGTWEREIHAWCSNLTPVRLEGSVAQRIRTIEQLMASPPQAGRIYAFITNYEALDRMQAAILALASQVKLGFVADEAHKIKTPAAKMTKAAIKIARKSPWRCVLTGTPVTNTGEDLWSQMYVTDMGVTFGPNFVAFRDEFFTVNQWSHQHSMRGGAEDTINARLQRRALRYRQQDCFDMPRNIYTTIPVSMGGAQRVAYDDMERDFIATVQAHLERGELPPWETDEEGDVIVVEEAASNGGTATASIILTQYLRLSQITSGFVPLEDGSLHFFDPNPKLDALEEEVRQRVEEDRSVIVWAWYRPDIEMIRSRLRDLNPVFITGGMSARETDTSQQRFQACETRLLIGNPGSGGMGINLSAADTAIYYSQSFNLEHREQSEARNQAPNGREANTYLDLGVPGTIDDIIRHRLLTKQSMAATLVEVRRTLGI